MPDLFFKRDEIEQAEKDWSKVQLTDKGRELLTYMAELHCEYLPGIPLVAMKAFIYLAIKDTQMRLKVDLGELLEFPKVEQERISREVSISLKKRLKKVLLTKEQLPYLEESLKQALKVSMERWIEAS